MERWVDQKSEWEAGLGSESGRAEAISRNGNTALCCLSSSGELGWSFPARSGGAEVWDEFGAGAAGSGWGECLRLSGPFRHWEAVVRAGEELFDFVSGQWSGEEVALAEAASHLLEELELIFGFDAFRDDIHAEDTGELDDGLDDLEGLLAALDALDKGAVDLEDVEGESVEVAEGAVAGTKVVHVERDAEVAQVGEDVDRGGHAGDEAGLGHFEPELTA